MNGFKIYNPKGNRDAIVSQLARKGWKHEPDAAGNICVFNRPIHVHGHGFAEDMVDIARNVPAALHVPHHIPDLDAQDTFRRLMDREGLVRPDEKSDDFKFYSIDAAGKSKKEKFRCVAHVDPSYILVRMARKFGQFFGGALEWQEARLLRREGSNRTDGLHARSESDGIYRRSMARVDWEHVVSPQKSEMERYRKLGPSDAERRESYGRPRSRPMWSFPIPEGRP